MSYVGWTEVGEEVSVTVLSGVKHGLAVAENWPFPQKERLGTLQARDHDNAPRCFVFFSFYSKFSSHDNRACM